MAKAKHPTLREFLGRFGDDETCVEHLFNVRFGQGHTCPKCGRASNWYRIKATRAYSCQWCGWHLHPTADTLFEDTRTPLQLWFYAIYLFTTSRHGVPAKELQRQLGVTYKTAWRMGHEIRKHMAAVDGDDTLHGVVEVDETYVGGHRPGKPGRGAAGKTIVLGMVERNGEIITKVIPDVKVRTIEPLVRKHVGRRARVFTDEHTAYGALRSKGYRHETVRHGDREYVRADVHTNTIEGYFARLKNSIRGTHVHVSSRHLAKYAAEFEYRYNSRGKPDAMLDELLSVFPQSDE